MAWRNIRPMCSHYRYGARHFLPPEGWPTRRVWVNRFEDDHQRLMNHPIWKVTPKSKVFARFAERPGNPFVAYDMADEVHGEPFGLVYCFERPEPGLYWKMVIGQNPRTSLAIGAQAVAMTSRYCEAEARASHALSWIVDVLARRDPDTMQPWADVDEPVTPAL